MQTHLDRFGAARLGGLRTAPLKGLVITHIFQRNEPPLLFQHGPNTRQRDVDRANATGNPNGIQALSRGLRGERYPGCY